MPKLEDEGFLAAKARKKRGARGKDAENTVHKILTARAAQDMSFDFDRLADSRACGRPLPQTVADFTFCCRGRAGAIEVKETEDLQRLSLSDFPQYPRMLRRILAGGLSILVVHHSMMKLWRVILVSDLPEITRGSWDLDQYHLTSKALLGMTIMEMIDGNIAQ